LHGGPLLPAARAPRVDPDVAAISPAQLRQALQERRHAGLIFRTIRGRGHEHADARHPLRLLRARRERPRRSAAEKCDERASSHVGPPPPESVYRALSLP